MRSGKRRWTQCRDDFIPHKLPMGFREMNGNKSFFSLWNRISILSLSGLGLSRAKMFVHFPTISLLKLAVSILININKEWIAGNRYLSVKGGMISLDTSAEFRTL